MHQTFAVGAAADDDGAVEVLEATADNLGSGGAVAVDKDGKRTVKGAVIGCAIGLVVTTVVYSLGRAFVYSTPEYAIMKLPYQIAQPLVGAIVGILLCFKFGLIERFDKMFK